ncbi:histone-like nucleoid-structuring protein Lsr2 [Micromonospora sp. NPDC048830]|uniref:Lsr2 family DNA-binding protein n=1 Tax=Micromonospora sp. NPDC048830 TaxID=3364257 RepID=UPI0037206A3C
MSAATMTTANGADRSTLVRAAQGKTAPTQRVSMGIGVIAGPGTSAAAPEPGTVARSMEQLLGVAAASESARTRQLAGKISGLVAELTGRVEAEETQRREREAAEEQRRKLAEAEAALTQQLAEVRQKLRTTRDSVASPPCNRRVGAEQRAAIREWALANGYEIKNRGRVSRQIVEAWAAATGAEVTQ